MNYRDTKFTCPKEMANTDKEYTFPSKDLGWKHLHVKSSTGLFKVSVIISAVLSVKCSFHDIQYHDQFQC